MFLHAWFWWSCHSVRNGHQFVLTPSNPEAQTTSQVFLRAWVAVDLPRLYNPVTNLLGPAPPPPDFPRARKEQEVTPRPPDPLPLWTRVTRNRVQGLACVRSSHLHAKCCCQLVRGSVVCGVTGRAVRLRSSLLCHCCWQTHAVSRSGCPTDMTTALAEHHKHKL